MGCYNFDIIGDHFYMNSHTVSEANNPKYIYYTNKSDENTYNRYNTENTRINDGVDIDVMLPTSKLHQYENMEYNNEYHYPLMNGKCQDQTTHQFLL